MTVRAKQHRSRARRSEKRHAQKARAISRGYSVEVILQDGKTFVVGRLSGVVVYTSKRFLSSSHAQGRAQAWLGRIAV